MINYTPPASSIGDYYNIDFFTVPFTQIVAGGNTITFNSGNWYNKVTAGYNVVPIQFILHNTYTGGVVLNFFQFYFLTGQYWIEKIDILNNTYTIAFPLDKTKVTHNHVDLINQPLSINFTPTAVPTGGDLTITVLFSNWI